jgi:hypothetical protein
VRHLQNVRQTRRQGEPDEQQTEKTDNLGGHGSP